MVDMIATEYEAKCNAFLLSTTFLKALYIQQPDLKHLTVLLCGYGLECCQKRKPSIELGFVKMGGKRLR